MTWAVEDRVKDTIFRYKFCIIVGSDGNIGTRQVPVEDQYRKKFLQFESFSAEIGFAILYRCDTGKLNLMVKKRKNSWFQEMSTHTWLSDLRNNYKQAITHRDVPYIIAISSLSRFSAHS